MPYIPEFDPLRTMSYTTSSPARNIRLITPSNTAPLEPYAKILYAYLPAEVESAIVRVTPVAEENDNNFVDIRVDMTGMLPPVQIRKVWASGTTPGIFIYSLADR